jgi:acylphosphatase
MTVARRVVVRGRVQGVGYRYATVDAAERLHVTGWVRNCRDGTVEALLQGSEDAVTAMIAWCRRGPAAAQVVEVVVGEAKAEPLADFTLRPTA